MLNYLIILQLSQSKNGFYSVNIYLKSKFVFKVSVIKNKFIPGKTN